jgi:hypothetical protein
MDVIPLAAEANQEFTVRLSDHRFTLRIKEANGVMVADVTVDDVLRMSATRILAGEPIIPYDYLSEGNFILITDGDALPDYRQFGSTQSLVYLSAAEIAAL